MPDEPDLDEVRFLLTQESESESEGRDQRLLEHLMQGDMGAFWALWEQHQGYLYRLCCLWLGHPEEAEDVLSEAMIKAWIKLPDQAGQILNLRAWLARLTFNLCMDLHRERARPGRQVQDLEDPSGAERVVAPAGDQPEEAFLHRERWEYIFRLINGLPLRLREPFALRILQERSYQDIAEQLHLSPENVRKRVQQARALLQERWEKHLAP